MGTRHAFDDINGLFDDARRVLLCDVFDCNATFGGCDDERAADRAVVKYGEILFHLGSKRLNHEDSVAGTAFRAGLFGDESVAQHGFGGGSGSLRRFDNVNAALIAGVELAEAAAAGENLHIETGLKRRMTGGMGDGTSKRDGGIVTNLET